MLVPKANELKDMVRSLQTYEKKYIKGGNTEQFLELVESIQSARRCVASLARSPFGKKIMDSPQGKLVAEILSSTSISDSQLFIEGNQFNREKFGTLLDAAISHLDKLDNTNLQKNIMAR